MRWKDKSNMTDTTVAGSDVLPITDVSTDQDRKITMSIIATWAVTKFTTSVAGASQTIVAAINAVRQAALNAATAAATAQAGVDQNAEDIEEANAAIAVNTAGIAGNASDIATLNQTMENTNEHVDELQDQVSTMDTRVEAAVAQAQQASEDAVGAANAASEAAETVQEIIDQGGMVLSVYGRSGIVEAQAGDYTSAQISHGENSTVADALTFDAIPVAASKRAVESGGVYSQLAGKVSKAGDTMTGTLYQNASDMDTAVTPTRSSYYNAIRLRDKNNKTMGTVGEWIDGSNAMGATFDGAREINGSTKYNSLRLLVNQSGEAVVAISGTNAIQAWRDTLGISLLYANNNNRNSLSINGMSCSGIITTGQTRVNFFIPFGDYIGGTPTLKDLAMAVRYPEGGYPFVRSGTNGGTYTQLGTGNISMIADGAYVRSNEIDSVAINGRRGSGFDVTINFKYPLAKASGSPTAITNNTPLAVGMTCTIELT